MTFTGNEPTEITELWRIVFADINDPRVPPSRRIAAEQRIYDIEYPLDCLIYFFTGQTPVPRKIIVKSIYH